MITQKVSTKYWHRFTNNLIQCDLCPHACKLKEGQHGICFVRKREHDEIVLNNYGRLTGLAIDPIEKKPLYHFLPGTLVYSFGSLGCNLGCKFCQNWNISKTKDESRLSEVVNPAAIVDEAKRADCKSVAFTYNEPTIFLEYLIDVAKACRESGIKTVAVTNGYINEKPRQEFFSYIDAANVDLKGFTNRFYQKITGAKLQPVLDTLIYLKQKTQVWLEITTLLIPGENDSTAELDAKTKWIVENLGNKVPIHFTAFYPSWKLLDKPSTSLATLIRAQEIAIKNGLQYVYIGNVNYPLGSITYCSNCKKPVIVRKNFSLIEYYLDGEGNCKYCQASCSGLFLN